MAAASEQSERLASNLGGLSEDDIQAELRRVLDGDAFKRSRRLQRFLRYITDLALAGQEDNINEYLIGMEVFDRGSDYNPGADSVVRRQAHSLRQKLGEYYSSQGKDNPIRIDVPLGHYIPTFESNPRAPASELEPAVAGPLADPSAIKQTLRRLSSTTTVAAVALCTEPAERFFEGRSTLQPGGISRGHRILHCYIRVDLAAVALPGPVRVDRGRDVEDRTVRQFVKLVSSGEATGRRPDQYGGGTTAEG